MVTVVGRLIVALLLLAGGAVLWTMARVERSLARASELAATLSPDAAAAYDDVERSLEWLRRLPRVADPLLADAREARMVADYAAGRFALLADAQSRDGAGSKPDPEHLFVAANAAYRLNRRAAMPPDVALRQLDAAAKRYADVLERQPGHIDAAYNYELVLRLRNRVARANRGLPPLQPFSRKGDLPVGPTLHGLPGAPPRGAAFGEFDLLIPLQPDEADMQDDGKEKLRRGKG